MLRAAGRGGTRLQADIATPAPRAFPARGSFGIHLRVALRSHAVQVALVISTAFVLRLAWALLTRWQPLPDDDAYRYDFLARALAQGRGYIHLNGAPTAFWPPGYPLILSTAYVFFGDSVMVAKLLNVALGTATVALVYLIGQRLFGQRVGLAASTIVALFPSLIFFTGVTLSETTFTFLIMLALWLLIVADSSPSPSRAERRGLLREHRAAVLLLGAGVTLGFAALTRGQALLLPLAAVPLWYRSGLPWRAVARQLAMLAGGIVLVVAPWTARNAIELGSPVLVATNAGVDFWIGHHDAAAGDTSASGGDALVYRYPELTTAQREVRVNSDGFREGLSYAVTHPAQELALPVKKFVWLFYNDEEGLRWNEGHGGQDFLPASVRSGLLTVSNVYYFAVLGLLALGTRRWFSLRDPGRLLLISIAVYWTAVHLAFFGNPRFHAPIMPLLALLAGLTWAGKAGGEGQRAR